MPFMRKHCHPEDPGRQTLRKLRHAVPDAGADNLLKPSEGIVNHHIHCSVCDYAALFQVRRFKKIGWEFACEMCFEWLNDNCRRPFEVRRVVDPWNARERLG